jgi:hypothetical protein
MDKLAFELFAKAYPHKAYAKWPNKFFKFFRKYYPLITKQEMVKILKRTDADHAGKLKEKNENNCG